MPIVALYCSTCGETVREEHYSLAGRCKSGVTPGHVRNILRHNAGRPLGWSVTQVKSCLRKVVVERELNCTVDPVEYLKMELGTANDAHIRTGETVRWHGILGGMEISGEPDGYDEAAGVIVDYKQGAAPASGVWKDHKWQVSVYAHLAPEGIKFTRGKIYYNAYAGKAGTPAAREFKLIIGEEALLDYEIHPGLTVRDNIETAKLLDSNPAEYPMTGEHISMGPGTLCDYCTVKDACYDLEERFRL